MITDPWFYAAAVPAALIAAVSKGGFGGGLVVMAVPIMSLAVPPVQAAAIMLPILCLTDLFTVWAYRKAWDKRNMLILFPAGLIGTGIGWASFRYLDDDAVRLLIGVIAISFALYYFLPFRRPTQAAGTSWRKGGFWGTVAGFTSFVAHAGGPPTYVYLLPQRMDKRFYVGTTAVFFLSLNYLKLIPYTQLGQFRWENVSTALVLLPLTPVGVWLGLKMQQRVTDTLFYNVCYACLLVTGLKLLADALHLF
jgi:uncharacterized protein